MTATLAITKLQPWTERNSMMWVRAMKRDQSGIANGMTASGMIALIMMPAVYDMLSSSVTTYVIGALNIKLPKPNTLIHHINRA